MNLNDMQRLLTALVDAHIFRAVDAELPVVLHRMAAQPDPLLWWLTALVSYQYGRGHTCLLISQLCEQPQVVLSIGSDDLWRLSERNQERWQQALGLLEPNAIHQALDSLWVQRDGSGDQAPLTWVNNRIYLTRLYRAEALVKAAVQVRLPFQAIPQSTLQPLIDVAFPEAEQARNRQEVHWQSLACALAVQRRFCIITGGPGTGKTTTVVRLLAVLLQARDSQLRIALAAPTGKAAARLTESIRDKISELPCAWQEDIPTDVVTLHKLLGARPHRRGFRYHQRNPLPADVVVIDEASMIDVEMMAALMAALPAHGQLILLGDKDQLASVEAGSVLGDFCAGAEQGGYNSDTLTHITPYATASLQPYHGDGSAYNQATVMLRVSHRFDASSGIGQLAKAVNHGADYSDLFSQFSDIDWLQGEAVEQFQALVVSGYRDYLELVQRGPQDNDDVHLQLWAKAVLKQHRAFQVLVALRQGDWGVTGLNQRIADWLYGAKLIPTTQGWYAGRPVLVRRNNYGLKLMNGDIGMTLVDPNSGRLRVAFEQPDGSIKWILPSRLADVETVFALTVHKSQGSEFKHAVLALPERMNPVLTRELIYTGITRASQKFTLLTPEPQVFAEAVQTQVLRSSGL
ncbi:exodeoxyribonuclease V subunit alpha [Aliidiomarina halalkaliphila]|nr:exodeoxyribonuclease V subunit alpha [Aliidiomarina halalkaliphila]